MIAVMRKASRATQFWGSSTVKVVTGGRKKKLNASTAASEVVTAAASPQTVAISRTASRNVRAAVVALTGMSLT